MLCNVKAKTGEREGRFTRAGKGGLRPGEGGGRNPPDSTESMGVRGSNVVKGSKEQRKSIGGKRLEVGQ